MKDIKTGYDAYWIGIDKYLYKKYPYTLPEYKLYLLHSTNNYAYFRLFSITYNDKIGDTENAIYTEITELRSNKKKKLKYSLRKDKSNWLGEIPCFKTTCNKYINMNQYSITLPFGLKCNNGRLDDISIDERVSDRSENVIYLGNTDMDTLEKQILEQKQKLEPPKQEEPKQEEPPSNKVANGSDAPLELSEESKIHEEEMNVFLQQLQFVSDNFTGGEKDSIIIGLCNLQVEKNMLKLKGHLLDKLKEEIKEKMGDSELFV